MKLLPFPARQADPEYFEISVAVQPGNSGGALVDERGNVVGVVSAKLNVVAAVATSGALPENVNYAVKSSFLLSFLESVDRKWLPSSKTRTPRTAGFKETRVKFLLEQAAVLILCIEHGPKVRQQAPVGRMALNLNLTRQP